MAFLLYLCQVDNQGTNENEGENEQMQEIAALQYQVPALPLQATETNRDRRPKQNREDNDEPTHRQKQR